MLCNSSFSRLFLYLHLTLFSFAFSSLPILDFSSWYLCIITLDSFLYFRFLFAFFPFSSIVLVSLLLFFSLSLSSLPLLSSMLVFFPFLCLCLYSMSLFLYTSYFFSFYFLDSSHFILPSFSFYVFLSL